MITLITMKKTKRGSYWNI